MKCDTQHNGTQYRVLLCWVLFVLSDIYAECHKQAHYAECHYADWYYAECHYAECHYAECHEQAHYGECRYAECHYAEFCNAILLR